MRKFHYHVKYLELRCFFVTINLFSNKIEEQFAVFYETGDMVMKQKTRRLSIRIKILIPTNLLMLAICVILGISAYRSINTGMVSVGVEEARMAGKIAVSVIDGDLVSELTPGCEETEGYQALLTSMREVQKGFGIAYLYTLYTDGKQVFYGVDTDESELQAKVGQTFEKSYEQLKGTFAGEDFVQDYIDHSEYGDVISIYMPVRNSEGQIVGAIGCDYDASNIVKKLNGTVEQVIIITLICMVFALILLNVIVGPIMGNLRRVNQKIYDLVHSEGDLTQKLEITTGDEMELIANNVNTLLEHIRGIMLNIAANSKQLQASSQNVVENLSKAEMNITDVSATMEEMSAAMEETSASLNQVNDAVENVYESIGTISDSAGEGKASSYKIMEKAAEIYDKAVEEQSGAKQQAQEMAAEVNEKIEKSKAVEQISILTSNIISITNQTNLLSLNASIEAARAGEAGKGFAVVADEIGKLATNSAETAVQIQQVSAGVIEAVNELAKKAGMMLEFMDETAMKGYEKLLETSGSYRNDVGEMNRMMQSFADESDQVKISIDQIKESISAVNIAVEESAKGITNVTEMAVDLTGSVGDIENEANSNMNVANQLNEEVNKFKLE